MSTYLRPCACSDDPDGDVESDIEENEDMTAAVKSCFRIHDAESGMCIR
jgi:hypothetical protein